MDKRTRKGKDHPNFKGGFPNCLVCGKQLSQRFYTHCIKHRPTGEKHPSWKGGKPRCLVCNRILTHYYNIYCVEHTPKDFQQSDTFRNSVSNRMQGNQFAYLGEKASVKGKHSWIRKHFGSPITCEHCGKTNLTGKHIHWANKDHTYRRVREDWMRLCPACHGQYDKSQGLRRGIKL